MYTTRDADRNQSVSTIQTHHLVTPQSQGKPLCGEQAPDAAIGAYVEHLDERGQFIREVFGHGGKPALACRRCLTLCPSVLL